MVLSKDVPPKCVYCNWVPKSASKFELAKVTPNPFFLKRTLSTFLQLCIKFTRFFIPKLEKQLIYGNKVGQFRT